MTNDQLSITNAQQNNNFGKMINGKMENQKINSRGTGPDWA
jgi:hypothetical protein